MCRVEKECATEDTANFLSVDRKTEDRKDDLSHENSFNIDNLRFDC